MTEEEEKALGALLFSDNKIHRMSGRLIATEVHRNFYEWIKQEEMRGSDQMDILQAGSTSLMSFLVAYCMMIFRPDIPEDQGQELGKAFGQVFARQFAEAVRQRQCSAKTGEAK